MATNNACMKYYKVCCNLKETQYEVVRHICKNIMEWSTQGNENWSIMWTDSAITSEKLSKMKLFQKINHFPGMYLISQKNYLASNLRKLKKVFAEEYNFFPRTWVAPLDTLELKLFLSTSSSYFIVKPEASCQGRGIFLTRRLEEIDTKKHVVQEYISNPYLIDGFKFDLRVYVLLTGCYPLRVFIYKEGLARFATSKYSIPSPENICDECMHLTNYAVNKMSSNFIHNQDPTIDDIGHKRSMTSIFKHLQAQGKDIIKLQAQIDDIIIKTLCCVQPILAHYYKASQPSDLSNSMCFEILGFDIIIDSNLTPFVLEVNHTPSFSTDSPLDWEIKKNLITDTLKLLNIRA